MSKPEKLASGWWLSVVAGPGAGEVTVVLDHDPADELHGDDVHLVAFRADEAERLAERLRAAIGGS